MTEDDIKEGLEYYNSVGRHLRVIKVGHNRVWYIAVNPKAAKPYSMPLTAMLRTFEKGEYKLVNKPKQDLPFKNRRVNFMGCSNTYVEDVQKALFKLGYTRKSGSTDIEYGCNFLLIFSDGKISYTNSLSVYKSHTGFVKVRGQEIIDYVKELVKPIEYPFVECKIKLYDSLQSINVQQKLFKLGYYWNRSHGAETVRPEVRYLYLYPKGKLVYGDTEVAFISDLFKKVTAEQILNYNKQSNEITRSTEESERRSTKGTTIKGESEKNRITSSSGFVGNPIKVGRIKGRTIKSIITGRILCS